MKLVLEDKPQSINSLIKSLDISEQMLIHSKLDMISLEYITKNKELMDLGYHVLEHIIWFYYYQLEWSDVVLKMIVEEYKQEPYVALESLILNAIKKDEISTENVAYIQNVFTGDEVQRQLFFWSIRKKIHDRITLSMSEIEKVFNLRGYELLVAALSKDCVDKACFNVFYKPSSGEKDRKWKDKLHSIVNSSEF